MSYDRDRLYQDRYEWALSQANITDAPTWEELTPQQQQNIRDEVHRHSQWMNDLGREISKG